MRMNTIQLSLTVMTAALLLNGCVKESFMESDSEVVKFSASVASPSDEVMTKASATETGNCVALTDKDGKISIPMELSTIPVIDGISLSEDAPLTKGALINDNENGDLSKIDLPPSIGSFKVAAWTDATASIPAYTDVTYANGKWSTSTTYTWKKGDEKTFIAYASLPSSATITSDAAGTQKLSYTVPDAVSAQTDILMGYYKGTGNDSGTAAITFYHPLTAVKFVVGDMEGVSAIKKISLKGVFAGGNTTQSAAGTSFTWEGTTSTMTVSQDITGNLPSCGSQVGEAFLLIPQTITEAAAIKVSINAIINGVPAELVATLSSGQWKAGYTNIYTLGYGTASYLFNIVDEGGEIIETPTLTYKNYTFTEQQEVIVSSLKKIAGVSSAQPWNIKSYKIGSSDLVLVEDGSSSFEAGYLNVVKEDNILKVTASERTNQKKGGHAYWINPENGDYAPEDWSTTKATDTNPLDLSMLNFKTELTNDMTTANCYIIRHAGTYKLPLVYGNAVVNGAVNEQSYYPNCKGDVSDGDDATKNNRLVKFKNHLGNDISSAFIENNSGCRADKCSIVWQDEALVIKDLKIVGSEAGNYTKDNVRYLQFTVDPSTICQNNAVIAVKDEAGQIMWSWLIWTTNDPTLLGDPYEVSNTYGKYSFFQMNSVGWMDETEYPERDDVVITIEQSETGETIEITVEQPEVSEPAHGNYYQFGRKDPMCRKDLPVSDGFVKGGVGKVNLKTAIMNPGVFYNYGGSGDINNWCSSTYDNLWSGKLSTRDQRYVLVSSPDLTKTVYDPSPAGYQMPTYYAFIDVPAFTAQGYRSRKSGNFSGFVENFYWSAIPYSDSDGLLKDTDHVDCSCRAHGIPVRPVLE